MNNWEQIKSILLNNNQSGKNGLEQSDIDNIEMSKRKTDCLNFKELYRNENEAGDLYLPNDKRTEFAFIEPQLKNYTDSKVFQAYTKIKEQLERTDPETHIGVISHGTHSIDYFTHFFTPEMVSGKNWNANKVMFVFEAPARNIGASYAFVKKYGFLNSSDWKERERIKKKYIEQFLLSANDKNEREEFEGLLSYHRWWLDRTEEDELDSLDWDKNVVYHLSQGKEYSYLISAFMEIFGLAHIYTTNLMRYELYKGFDKNGEISLNWGKAQNIHDEQNGKTVIDLAYESVFLEEVKAFQPKIIFATANPYNYIWWKKKESYLEHEGIRYPIVKIPHPANQYLTKEQRLCLNICYMAKALEKHGIIDDAVNVINQYYLSNEFEEL